MFSKSADALSFLRVSPNKKSKSLEYELLAKKAADEYIHNNVDPNQTIADIAKSKGFNDEQTQRIVEFANHDINSRLSKTSSDQLFTFPVATLESVKKHMYGRSEKSAEFSDSNFVPEEIDFGIYEKLASIPDYADVMAAKRFNFNFKQQVNDCRDKTASYENEKHPLELEYELKNELSKISSDIDLYSCDVREDVDKLRNYWSSLSDYPEIQEDFAYAVPTVMGNPELSYKVAALIGGNELSSKVVALYDRGEDLEKAASLIDPDHEAVEMLSKLAEDMGKLEDLLEKKANVLKSMASAGARLASKTKNDFTTKFSKSYDPKFRLIPKGRGKNRFFFGKAVGGMAAGAYVARKLHGAVKDDPTASAAMNMILPVHRGANLGSSLTVGKSYFGTKPVSRVRSAFETSKGMAGRAV